MKKFFAIVGWVVAVPLLALMWLINDSAPDDQKAAKASARELDDFRGNARVACSLRIKEALRNPASVEWDSRFEWPVIEDGDGLYTVIAKYRAENGFGGMNNEARQCLVARSGERAAILGIE